MRWEGMGENMGRLVRGWLVGRRREEGDWSMMCRGLEEGSEEEGKEEEIKFFKKKREEIKPLRLQLNTF